MISADSIQIRTVDFLKDLLCEEIALPSTFRANIKPEAQGELRLHNRFFNVNHLGELRTVTVQSPKISILNLLFFPDPKQQLPAYAAEFVCLSGKPIIAVIDAKCLLPSDLAERVKAIMTQARSNFNGLIIAEAELPEWFARSRSGYEIFIRPKTLSEMERVMGTHLDIWCSLVALFKASKQYAENTEKDHLNCLNHYKKQHCFNYPGIPLLQRCFGEEWTGTYLNDYLFG